MISRISTPEEEQTIESLSKIITIFKVFYISMLMNPIFYKYNKTTIDSLSKIAKISRVLFKAMNQCFDKYNKIL